MPLVVVVTGANKGIGYEISKKLIAGGAEVIMTARDQSRLDKAASELRPFGAVTLDTTSEDSVEEAKREVRLEVVPEGGLCRNEPSNATSGRVEEVQE